MFLKVLGLFCLINYSTSFIVPQEVPSLLSLVYSNIPPIRKGSDSRYGIGFRLGEHADFQVMVELGPQSNTRPIGNAANTNNKRDVIPEDYDEEIEDLPETDGGKWLANWSKNSEKPSTKSKKQQNPEIKPFIATDALRQLQQLYVKPAAQNINLNNFNANDNNVKLNAGTTTSSSYLPYSLPQATSGPTKFQILIPDLDRPEHTNRLKHHPKTKSKTQITKELMDVNLD